MKYGIIKNLISDDLRIQMINLMDLIKDHSMNIDDNDPLLDGTSSPAYYGIFNSIQLEVLPKIENAFNVKLVPTYNYSRIYYNDSILLKHIDRPSCEYSITINLFQEDGIWPIWMEYDSGPTELHLNPGDAAWYKGCEVLHWRNKNTKGIGYQSFMHYVEKNGKYSKQIYDNRMELWYKNLENPMYQFDF
jgi:hypothetical protein